MGTTTTPSNPLAPLLHLSIHTHFFAAMSMSGVTLDSDVVSKYNDFKLNKLNAQYLIMKIVNETSIQIVKEGPKGATYNDFLKEFSDDAAMYAILDYRTNVGEGRVVEKLVFINWAPSSCKIKERMLYASSKAEIKKGLLGLAVELQANEFDDLDEAEIKAKL